MKKKVNMVLPPNNMPKQNFWKVIAKSLNSSSASLPKDQNVAITCGFGSSFFLFYLEGEQQTV